MLSKEELRARLRESLDTTIYEINRALRGENLEQLEEVLTRIGRGGRLPHWYEQLKTQQTLPNLDGKTIGSVIEMLLVAVLEKIIFQDLEIPPLRINPARGIDLPDLDIRIKSPSENYCTSEPFFSAYERLIGSEYDALILLTDYQTAKKKPPLKLQIIKFKYLDKTQIADYRLCQIAKINSIQPFYLGVIDAADNWVIEMQKDLARFPNSNEWARILTSPLDGQIGMSPALQWRYNFSRVFGVPQPAEDELSLAVETEL